jgi:hypothetical protein
LFALMIAGFLLVIIIIHGEGEKDPDVNDKSF